MRVPGHRIVSSGRPQIAQEGAEFAALGNGRPVVDLSLCNAPTRCAAGLSSALPVANHSGISAAHFTQADGGICEPRASTLRSIARICAAFTLAIGRCPISGRRRPPAGSWSCRRSTASTSYQFHGCHSRATASNEWAIAAIAPAWFPCDALRIYAVC